MKRYIYIAAMAALAGLTTLSSCEDFLDTENYTQKTPKNPPYFSLKCLTYCAQFCSFCLFQTTRCSNSVKLSGQFLIYPGIQGELTGEISRF